MGLLVVTGCRSNEANKGRPAVTTAAPAAKLDPATLGAVAGAVKFAGKAPERLKIDMSMDPVCAVMGGDNYAEQFVVKDGKLANVYAYIKDGPPIAMGYVGPTPAPVVMDQVGCRYTPHVIAVMHGGLVEFRNSDGTMHNIHTMSTVVGNETIDISQGPKGAPVTKRFKEPEVMIPVRCNNHPWMNAFINVAPTPFFAVTGADGQFKIDGLPPGTYTLGVVHEKMGEQTMKITIAPHGTATADFTFAMK